MSRGQFSRGGPGGGRRDGRRDDRGGGKLKPTPLPAPLFRGDGDDTINAELLATHAERQAEQLARSINSAQLRRFFGDFKDLVRRLRHGENFGRLLPMIKMLRSKVYYASRSGGQQRIDRSFAEFVLGCIDEVRDEKTFKGTALYFEAVVGYMYGMGLKDGR